MKTPVPRLLNLASVFVAIAFAAPHGFAQSPRVETRLSWNSPQMHKLENEYNSLRDTKDISPEKIAGKDGKSKYGEVFLLTEGLFRRRLKARDLQQLVASCDSLPADIEQRRGFVNALLAFMVEQFVQNGDRKALVQLLSSRCPVNIVADHTIEFYLASHAETLTDPILILAEAYSKCETPEVRRDLAAAIRRSFADQGISSDDDTEFVANAVKWYRQERDYLVSNELYFLNFANSLRKELLFQKHVPATDPLSKRAVQVPQWFIDEAEQPLDSAPIGSDAEGKTPEVLVGTWQVVAVSENGRPLPRNDRRRIQSVTISDQEFIRTYTDGTDRKSAIRFPAQQLNAMDFLISTSKSDHWKRVETTPLIEELLVETITVPAIYEVKHDSLRICEAPPHAHRRPTSFETFDGSGRTVYTLQRAQNRAFPSAEVLGMFGAMLIAGALLLRRKWRRCFPWGAIARGDSPGSPAK